MLFRRIRRVERRFFSPLLRSRWTLFEKPKQQNQEKCRGGYFRRDNRDQRVPGFQTGPMSTSTGAEWSCARSVLAIITSVSSENKLVGSKRNTRKHRRPSTRKKPVDMVTFPATLDAHEADPKQQCDRDANDATKSFDAESYDFDTV